MRKKTCNNKEDEPAGWLMSGTRPRASCNPESHGVVKNLNYRAAARRPCGFESVLGTDSLNHARLSWRVYLLILYFTGDLPQQPSERAGSQQKYENTT
eukprot:3128314-Pleurochrysis_carterae.AAC.2